MSKTEVPQNREAWLTAFGKAVEPLIFERTRLKPTTRGYRLSCGWPVRGGGSASGPIGQCFSYPDDGKLREIFISPKLDQSADVAHVTVHEMLHAFLSHGVGHRKPFSQAAKKMGLEGKPTATVAGAELAERLRVITDELGPYPHEELTYTGGKEKTRLLKVFCPDCGYIARITSKWINDVGCPICPQCQIEMRQDFGEGDDEVEAPLEMVDQTTEYRVANSVPCTMCDGKGTGVEAKCPSCKGTGRQRDERFRIRMVRNGRNASWFVLDFEPEGAIAEGLERFAPQAARLTPAESRQDAVDLIEGLRGGLTTYKMLDGSDEMDDPQDLTPEWMRELADDEDETPDYKDSILSPEELAEYEAEMAGREAWVKNPA